MHKLMIVMLCSCVWATWLVSQDEQQENAMLRQRMEKLEAEMARLQGVVQRQDADQDRLRKLEAENAELRQRLDNLEKTKGTSQASEAQTMIKVYGYAKLDMAYDSARTAIGDVALWVETEAAADNDDNFDITAKESRLGIEVQAPETLGIKVSGKIEFDFYGKGGSDTEAAPRMRHAYLQLDWPEWDFSILAGQSWDLVGPQHPNTVNFGVLWGAGNIGFRRPQLRVSKGFSLGDQGKLLLQAALARTMGRSSTFSGYPSSYMDSGSDVGFPTTQARVAFSSPLWTHKAFTIGIFGHWAQEEYDISAANDHKIFDSWSAGIDLCLPIADKLLLKGELWMGENLDAYAGGAIQGVNTVAGKEIFSKGGWFMLSCGPWSDFTLHAGASIDDPRDTDLKAKDRKQNMCLFGVITYDITTFLQTGVEVGYWKTLYLGQQSGDSVRVQSSIMFKF